MRQQAAAAAAATKRAPTKEEIARGPTPEDFELEAVAEDWLEEHARDPDSLKVDGCSAPHADGAFWRIDCAYRARNGFGGMNREARRFYLQQGEVARSEEIH